MKTIARAILESAIGTGIRHRILRLEAQSEARFVFNRAKEASGQVLDLDTHLGSLGPSDGLDTLFILGSGSSVEELTERNWEEIGRQRSVGINTWVAHPFVPDLYSFESVPRVGDGEDFSRSLRFLEREAIIARNPTILLLRPRLSSELAKLHLVPQELKKNLVLYGRISPATRRESNLSEDLRYFFSAVAPQYPSVLIDSGASVVRMVSLATLLGFRKIVLAGVDLNGSPYFWERNPSYLRDRPGGIPVNNQRIGMHETTLNENRAFGVISMLRVFNDYLHSSGRSSISITSESSALADFFPLHRWEKP